MKIKNFDATDLVAEIRQLDTDNRNLKKSLDDNLMEQNRGAKEIGMLFKEGKREEAEGLKARMAELKEAEKTGREINALFPGEPVYVHFYSPRWICRMGNYRTYEEAHQILNAVKKLGYKSAIIVKGKITVPYLPANTVTTTNP